MTQGITRQTGVGKVIGDDEGTARIHGHPDQSTTGLAVLSEKAGDKVDRRTV